MKISALPTLPVALILLVVVATWPGYLTHDSALQFYMARTWTFTELSPPVLPALWGILLRLGLPGSSGIMVLIGLSFAVGYAALVQFALAQREQRLAWILAVAGSLCPLLLLLLPHVWTDIVLAGLLLSAVGLILLRPKPHKMLAWAIGMLLLIATGVRQNAFLATLPVLIWWVNREWPLHSRRWRASAITSLMLIFLSTKAALGMLLLDQRLDFWAMVALFDLQAVSVAEQQQRLPVSVVGPGMTVEQLEAAFHPYSVTYLFFKTQSGVIDPTIAPLTPRQKSDLLEAWLLLPMERAWWAHRARLFMGLLGNHEAPELAELADRPTLIKYADNPDLERAFPEVNDVYRATLDQLRQTPLYAPGFYLLLGLFGAALLWRTGAGCWSGAAAALLGSAWLYTLPYFVVAPTAETRYLLWPALASWQVLLIALGAPGQGPRRASR